MTNPMIALLELRAVNASCSDVSYVGTYEIRMAARTVKRSVLTILRKNRGLWTVKPNLDMKGKTKWIVEVLVFAIVQISFPYYNGHTS